MLIFVSSPLRANTEDEYRQNMMLARKYQDIITVKYKCRAIAPHSFLPLYLDDSIDKERDVAIKFCLDLLKICDKIVVCGNTISSGMQAEIDFAKENNICIEYYKECE